MILFDWQAEAAELYFSQPRKDFLLQVVPGGGKTIFGLYVAKRMLVEGTVGRVIVVAPTLNIKAQWKAVAAEIGLKLYDDEPESDGNGIVCTYQQVAYGPEVFAETCAEDRTLVIFDEVHHAGDREDGQSWGDTAGRAFENASNRLSLTGTPFRSDDYKIAFVDYVDGKCLPDYVYSYQQALAAGICRNVQFQVFGGSAAWQREGEDVREVALGDQLRKVDTPKVLKAILDPSGDFCRAMMRHADQSMTSMFPAGSAGLVLANDCKHARELSHALEQVTGIKPVLATTESGGVKKIKAFRDSSDRWIVAVRQVSEGVDIPRLRVACYLTRTRTELFYIQAVGRVLRTVEKGEREHALFYIPGIQELVDLAQSCFDNRTHEISGVESVGTRLREQGSPTEVRVLGSTGFLSGTITVPQLVPMAAMGYKTNPKKAWKERNPDKEKFHQKTWRAANPERLKEHRNTWKAANPEKVKEIRKAWRAANPEKVKAKKKRYRDAHRDELNAKNRARHARKRLEQQQAATQ